MVWLVVALFSDDPPLIGWVLPLTATLIAAWGAWRAGTPQTADMPRRYFWRYVAVGVVLIGCGSVSNGYDYLHGGQYTSQVSALTSAIYLCGLLVMMVGLLRIPGTRRSRAEWTRFGLDIATVIVTVLTFSWHLLHPKFANGGLGGTWSALAVVGGGFICVFAFVKVAFTGTGAIDRRSLHLLALTGAVGAGGGAFASLVAAFLDLANGPVLVPVVCLVLCLAVDRQQRAAFQAPPPSRPLSGRPSVMPYAAVLFTGTLLLVTAQDGAEDILAVAVGAVTVTVLVATRQMMALRDNAALVSRLDARLYELGEYQQQLNHQATHDELTGLANRAVLNRDTTEALAADPAQVGVVLIDLDNFKIINDELGHAVGDALLTAVAARISANVPAGTTVARLGGDEYVLLLRTGSTAEHEAALIRLTEQLRRPVSACGHDLVIEASIGLAPAGAGDTAEELLRRADVAMYEAKSQGRGRYVVYAPDMDQRGAEQARIAADLRVGLDTGQLHLLYQPIVAIADGSVYGVEALVRWTHPQRGPVGPVDFIPAAERTGLIVPLGAWILGEACRQAVRWQQELGDRAPRTVSVNVSARQLREAGFAADVAAVLLQTGLAPDRLTVEVTETAVFDDGTAMAELHAIKALGVTIALDDFGTGHSSLGLLRTCPVDTLKVDKSFVDNVTQGGQHAVVAEALIHISNGLQLRAVAEGVETAEQADALYRLGYRYAQGYHYARPLPAAEVGQRLSQPASRLSHSG
ncbi:putative bifunctional diguanylate cyclase/phosphodiesterase [Actinoplanes friuliensis]|uniref:putative bifunctional diguanylate cyclase/phosphodiesterase n=1 Tax=Actinoplanes friuliensis TaxID=196914 RepID=UPI0004283D0C|nr:EAL domain-containing protein [Actinoplanes friuliensis]